MILVLASSVDEAAVAFTRELAKVTSASVITCRDLGEESTSLCFPEFHSSTITVRGQLTPVTSFKGVINLLPAVFPDELFFYAPEEREYQASEFHALLTFFLSAMTCPVVNRPTPVSLSGPYLSPIGWYHLAHRLGLPLSSIDMDSDSFVNPFVPRAGGKLIEVSYLGGRLISPSETIADEYTIAFARWGKVEYLRAVYRLDGPEEPQFVNAHTVPDVRCAMTRRALIEFFERAS